MCSHKRKEGMSEISSMSEGACSELASRGEPLVQGSGRRRGHTVDFPVQPMHSGSPDGHRKVDRH